MSALAQSPDSPQPQVSDADRAISAAAFKRFDANVDGLLSRDEVARLPAIASKFNNLDTNKDGLLSPEEFSAGLQTAP